MKIIARLFLVIILAAVCVPADAQNSKVNPYSRAYQDTEVHSFGTFFVEYNPHKWSNSYNSKYDRSFHGVSVGFSYFVPLADFVGFDAGAKVQYLFCNEEKDTVTYKHNMFSATIPVNIVLDFKISESFAIDPYAGFFARYNFSAKNIEDYTNKKRRSVSWFNDRQTSYYGLDKLDRIQLGWQLGVNLRFSDMVTIGAGYWGDFSKICDDTKLHGFNIRLGANF